MNTDNQLEESYFITNEPEIFVGQDLEMILFHAANQNASDITLQANEHIYLEIYGRLHKCSMHTLNDEEMKSFAIQMCGLTQVEDFIAANTHDLDGIFKFKKNNQEFRFRFNVTSVQSANMQMGHQITFRYISKTKSLEEMGLNPEIFKELNLQQGIVCISGSTGCEKSSIGAAFVRSSLEDPLNQKEIVVLQDNHEFLYDDIHSSQSVQYIGYVNIESSQFANDFKKVVMKEPSIFLVDSIRDANSINQFMYAARHEHLVYVVLTGNGVSDSMRRMLNAFESHEKSSKAFELITSTKLIISQMLYPSVKGGRVGIHEFLVFTPNMVEELLNTPLNLIEKKIQEFLLKNGQTFEQDAQQKLKQGLITTDQYKTIKLFCDKRFK